MDEVNLPLTPSTIADLHAGDHVLLTGIIYTARDAAHQRLQAMLESGEKLPIDLVDMVIYYCGPSPTPPGRIIGSCGPTTSGRMDPFTPLLLQKGVRGMIGKGARSKEVIEAIIKEQAVYFVALGGAGALLSKHVLSAEVVAFDDLGPEAIHKLTVKDFPCIVAIDSTGKSVFA